MNYSNTMKVTHDRSVWLSCNQVRTCPLCGCEKHFAVSQRMQHELNLQTVICSHCSFIFTNPMPSPETYERFNAEAYAHYYGCITSAPVDTVRTDEPELIGRRLDQIENVSKLKDKRVLEIGSGQGLFLWWLRKRGCEVLGIEPNREFCPALAKAHLPYRHTLLSQINPVEIGSFDVLVMSHVLEHFYEPDEALIHCRRLLTKGGLLVIEVPNILKPFRSLDRYFLRYVHPSSFSPATLRAFLERNAFHVEFMDEGGNDWRTPQNIFAIASKQKWIPDQSMTPAQTAKEVLHILQCHRKTWSHRLAAMWMIRDAWLLMRKTTIQWARSVKRELFAFEIAPSR